MLLNFKLRSNWTAESTGIIYHLSHNHTTAWLSNIYTPFNGFQFINTTIYFQCAWKKKMVTLGLFPIQIYLSVMQEILCKRLEQVL